MKNLFFIILIFLMSCSKEYSFMGNSQCGIIYKKEITGSSGYLDSYKFYIDVKYQDSCQRIQIGGLIKFDQYNIGDQYCK